MKCTKINHEFVVLGSAEVLKVQGLFYRTGKRVY